MDMSAIKLAGCGQDPSQFNSVPDVSAPLTVEIAERLNSNTAVALEVQGRLFALRDRLFGSEPSRTEPDAQAGIAKEPYAFADVARTKGLQLRDILNNIDALSADIANRL